MSCSLLASTYIRDMGKPMSADTPHFQDDQSNKGLWAGVAAYTIWGLFPIYFVLTKSVPALELLSHRIIWSVILCAVVMILRKQLGDIAAIIKNLKLLGLLAIGAAAVAANWGIYIWAVQHGQIFQGSLGYYINPLVYVLVGVVFFQERLSPMQLGAIVLAVLGVLILVAYGGVFPGISLMLAATFTCYGVVKRMANVRVLSGLFVETAILFIPALIFMGVMAKQGQMQFTQNGLGLDILILLAGPITVIPLLAFAFAARRITMSMLGILQFIGPTLQFVCALYFGETLSLAHILCFVFIWLGVGLFCWDSLRKHKTKRQ